MSANLPPVVSIGLSLLGAAIAGGLTVALAGPEHLLVGSTGGFLVVLLLLAGLSAVRNLSGATILFLGGLVALFLGERMFAEGTGRWLASGLGAGIVLASVGVRAFAAMRSEGRLLQAHRLALALTGVAVAGLGLYALTLDAVLGSLLDGEEAIARTRGALGAIWPILVLAGALPVAAIDRLISLHPLRIPPRAVGETATQWLSAGLAIALVFPVNYLAAKHDTSWDVAYFRTTAAGESTLSVVRTLTQPVTVTLFYPSGSDVGRELDPYFAALVAASDGRITVNRVDQALSPEKSEALKIRDNGYVVFEQGDSVEKFKLTDDLDKAKRDLRKLDETVQEHLLKVSRGKKNAYFVVGHGEANFRERENQLRKLNLFKTALESQNFKVGNLGVAEGLANAVPDDADVLIVAAPEDPFHPEEIAAITAWLEKGGSILVMAEPDGDPMTGLLGWLGVTLGDAPLAHASNFVPQTRGIGDRVLLATNRFGSHTSVKTLAKNGTTLSMIVPTVASVEKAADSKNKVSALVRTFPDTWPDRTPDRQKGPDEMGKVWDIAVASTGADEAEGFRSIVIGDATWASDPVLQFSQGNQVFLLDGLRWLVREDDISGTVNNEEDVKIQHTRDEDWAWFYVTVVAMPLLVLGLGGIFVRMRGRRS